jgi:hypothetical protein
MLKLYSLLATIVKREINKAFCVVSFLKGPNTIYSVGIVLGYQYIVLGQKKSMTTQKALTIRLFLILEGIA